MRDLQTDSGLKTAPQVPDARGVIRARMPVEIANRGNLGNWTERLAMRGYSVSRVAREIGINHSHVSNFIRGRKKSVGKQKRRMIRMKLVEIGVLKARIRKPPVCRCCGAEYPTRHNHSDVRPS